MKTKNPNFPRSILALVFGLVILFSASSDTLAASPKEFGRDLGLVVHTENRDRTVTRLKALQVLRSYFPGAKVDLETDGPVAFMSQREFLLWFEKLRLESEGKRTKLSDDELYRKTWLRVRRSNLLPQTRLTYGAMQEFLYRYSVSEKHGGHPFMEGLVLSEDEINADGFNSLYGVREMKSNLFAEVLRLKTLGVLSKRDRDYLEQISSYYKIYGVLEAELEIARHPFSQIADMSQELRQVVIDNDLNEVLASISYDYSHNENYRKHNLVTGTSQMHGRLYQPGETINFTDILASGGWNQYRFGWVIFGGKDEWQFGGGLCGSATMAFTPSWRSGLEIVSRFPHSAFYRNLYPEGSLGLDATIYRGAKNLIMRNSTNDPILYYVKDDPEKEEITLYLIGNAPYYHIEIEGPIEVSRNTYKWVRRMQQFDGTVLVDELTTRYGLVY